MVNDILLDIATGDLLIKDGDFVIGESDEQNLEDLVMAMQGDFKASPLTGAGGRGLKNNRNQKIENFERDIKEQLAIDNWREEQVIVNNIEDITVIASKK